MNGERADTASPDHGTDFSLVLGGPLYQLLRRAHLSGDILELVARRMATLSIVAWLPLLLLALAEGLAWGDAIRVPFLLDIDVHVKLLVGLPLLIFAELVVHERMRGVVSQFSARGLLDGVGQAQFDAAVASAMRLRNSIPAEILLLVFVYVVGVGIVFRTQTSIAVTSWYHPETGHTGMPSLSGWWYELVSLPLVQFILLRWYYRIVIWARFLWQVSRIDLRLVPIHPDRAGGLGFLPGIIYAFGPLLVGQGAMLAGVLANKILHQGSSLLDFKWELTVWVTMMVLVVFGPLLVFAPRLARARRTGMREYGMLAQRYVRGFHDKWVRDGGSPGESLLGSSDIQSLADLGNAFDRVRDMSPLLITRRTIMDLVFLALIPMAPLVLTLIPLDQLLDRLIGMLF